MKNICFKVKLASIFLSVSITSWSQIITTVAGIRSGGYSGDGGQATSAEFNAPNDIALDVVGNIYIADAGNNRIRIIYTTGIINTFAGNGVESFSGDGGPATAAEFNLPQGVAIDIYGNVYIADQLNERVRKISTGGIISTIAGNGQGGYGGDGGQATNAELYSPYGVAVDALGNVYIADRCNGCIRRINPSGIINTIAGNGILGYCGDGGPATAAELYYPTSVALDASGNIYVADEVNNRIREINTNGIINTIAGDGIAGYYGYGDNGPATAAELSSPNGVAVDANGNIYIAGGDQRVRKINTSGVINTFAGDSGFGFSGDGGPATSGELKSPMNIAFDKAGNAYIIDLGNSDVRKISSVTGINEILFSSNGINIFPTPTTGSFSIQGISNSQVIELYNYEGKKVLSTICHQLSVNFDISNQANGIYLVRVLNKDGSVFAAKKIVKTN